MTEQKEQRKKMKALLDLAIQLVEEKNPNDVLYQVLHNCPLCGHEGLAIVSRYMEYDDTIETCIMCPSCRYDFKMLEKRKKTQLEAILLVENQR